MEQRNLRKERIGIVTSNKMEKSIVVSEVKRVKHPMYGKFVLRTKKYVAHDEKNDCNIGDTVKIMETKPISKNKCWRIIDIIERALHLFDEVTIAIATSASKKPIFTLEERIEHVEKIFEGNKNVKAIGFTGSVSYTHLTLPTNREV